MEKLTWGTCKDTTAEWAKAFSGPNKKPVNEWPYILQRIEKDGSPYPKAPWILAFKNISMGLAVGCPRSLDNLETASFPARYALSI